MKKRLIVWALVVALILTVPLVAMQFSSEWNWDPFDFVFMVTLLFGAGLTYELISRITSNFAYRFAVGSAVATAVLLIWANAAVGIISDEDLTKLMYFGVVFTGFIGAVLVRFKPQRMERALFAAAVAQALVAVNTLIFDSSAEQGPLRKLAMNGFFVGLLVGSALLFRRVSAADSK